MGFETLRIVSEKWEMDDSARKTAYQAHDILQNIQVYQTLEEAITDQDLIIGTTAKPRKNRYLLIPSFKIKSHIDRLNENIDQVAIVFGSESNGLSQQDERLCHFLSTIPMAMPYPSINLSHSVMIYAYELSRALSDETPNSKK
jgi:tRNA/rRNA methyltransferase